MNKIKDVVHDNTLVEKWYKVWNQQWRLYSYILWLDYAIHEHMNSFIQCQKMHYREIISHEISELGEGRKKEMETHVFQ